MKCIDKLQKSIFSLADMYGFEQELKSTYPENQNVKPKIRQQLQELRNLELLEFCGNGKYRMR